MKETHFGGIVEYSATLLLLVQILMARAWLLRGRVRWPRVRYIGTVAALTVVWATAALAIALVWSGATYTMRAIPVALRVGVAGFGYLWILLSSLGGAVWLAARFAVRRLAAGRLPATHSPARRKALRTAGLIAIAGPSAAVAYGAIVERNDYGVAELDLPVPDLHPDLEGFRIVQVSDLHVSPFLSVAQAGRVVDMANELGADLAVFTGDLITASGDPLNAAIRELVRLRAPYGVLGCMGNHEEYIGCRNYLERQARPRGVNFLRGKNTPIRRGEAVLNVAGVDYQRNSSSANYIPGAERLVLPGAANLLLSHNPDVFPTALRRGFQAVLSGHTHGGQINVEILDRNINPVSFRTPFTKGLYTLHGATEGTCYVTNGVGTIGIPVRLGAPPEIALLRLRRA